MTLSIHCRSGREPRFSQPLHVGRPNIGDRAALTDRIHAALDRRWLSNDGPLVREFEERLADLLQVKHCIAVCNATIGLQVMARASELVGEVIVPANTFAATAHALRWVGLTPVFCDIDPQTHNLDPRHAESLLTSRTAAIVGVHLWGRACCPAELETLATRHDVPLFFDAAHAFGCSWRGRMIGGFGQAEVFSFHATKFVNCGEGGAIATADDNLAARCRRLRSFGLAGCDEFLDVGINGKLSELGAAMGLTSLDSMDQFIQINQENYRAYREALADIPGIRLISYDVAERNNYQYVVLEVVEPSPLSRDQWLQVLHSENVLARRYFYPGVHRMAPYSARRPISLPHTEAILRRVLVMPTGSGVSADDIVAIGEIFRDAAAQAPRLRRELPELLPLPTAPLKAA